MRGAKMDVEAPAAPRWRKRTHMLPITHTRQRRSYFQPLLLGSPQRRNAARPRPRPHAGARGAGVAPRDGRFAAREAAGFPVCRASEEAVELVLLAGDAVVAKAPLRLVPGRLTRVRL